MRLIMILFLLFLSSAILAQTGKQNLLITHLTGDYYIFTSYHLYKNNLASANGMYLVTNKGVVMFDTPWDTTQFQPLLDSIKKKHGKNVILCIATHSHEDRTAGLEFLKEHGVATFTSSLTDQISKKQNQKR